MAAAESLQTDALALSWETGIFYTSTVLFIDLYVHYADILMVWLISSMRVAVWSHTVLYKNARKQVFDFDIKFQTHVFVLHCGHCHSFWIT